MSQEKQIFISYRRDGGDTLAHLLYGQLTADGYSVFYDIESLQSGKFDTALYRKIMDCTDFLLILSPHCLDRCISPEDWLRREIEFAKNCGKNIIPLMVRGFEFSTVLPDSLADLHNYQGIEINIEHFKSVISKLENTMLHSRPEQVRKKEIMEHRNQRVSEDQLDEINAHPHLYSSIKTNKVPYVVKPDSIRCPHCSCAYYKKHQFKTDIYFEPQRKSKKPLKFLRFLSALESDSTGGGVLLIFNVVVAIGIMIAYVLTKLSLNIVPSALIGIAIIAAILWLLDDADKANMLLKRIKSALVLSGYRYQSLKCVGCEDTFSVIIPNEGELKDWLPGLIETDMQNNDL